MTSSAATPELHLTYREGCPVCLVPRLALAEKWLPFERRAVPRTAAEDGALPLLRDGRFEIPGARVACEYLEDRFPTPALYPGTAEGRAEARLAIERIERACLPPLCRLRRALRDDRLGDAELASLRDGARRGLAPFEERLERHDHVVEKALSFADLWLFAAVELALGERLLSLPEGAPIVRWCERLRERSSAKGERL